MHRDGKPITFFQMRHLKESRIENDASRIADSGDGLDHVKQCITRAGLSTRCLLIYSSLSPQTPRSLGVLPHGGEQAEHYLVPARLDRKAPAAWDSDWEPSGKVALRYSLTSRGLVRNGPQAPLNDWLARAAFWRLIVWLHPLAQGREHANEAAHWESGLRLRDRVYGEARLLAKKDRLYFEGSSHLRGHVSMAVQSLLDDLNRRFGTEMLFPEHIACQPAANKAEDCPLCPHVLEGRRYFTAA